MSVVYKICPAAEWRAAERAGVFAGSAADVQDGFIHFSTEEQVPGTLERHFSGVPDLLLIAVNAAALGVSLKWEPSRGGALFPHLYGALPLSAVLWAKPLANGLPLR